MSCKRHALIPICDGTFTQLRCDWVLREHPPPLRFSPHECSILNAKAISKECDHVGHESTFSSMSDASSLQYLTLVGMFPYHHRGYSAISSKANGKTDLRPRYSLRLLRVSGLVLNQVLLIRH